MAKTFELKVTDPDGIVYETDKATSLIIPSAEGFMGILADHAPVIAELKLGVATLEEEGKEPLRIVVSGGFVEVLDNTVMMLAEAAEREDEIDTERAERAKEQALKLLEDHTRPDYDHIQARLERALLRLKVAGVSARRK